MLDSYNRPITYLRVSVTDRCNLRCFYCMPEAGIRLLSHDAILTYEQIAAIAGAAVRLGIDKLRLTGGEPLVRRHIGRLVEQLKALPGIREVALTTNATLLAGQARELKDAGLDRLNISLDTLDPEKYRRITRTGKIADVLAGIEAAQSAEFRRTKLNMVLIPGLNDLEIPSLERFCQERGMTLQRIRHYRLSRHPGNRPGMEAERPLACKTCNRIRLTADGCLKPCLFSDREIKADLADPSRSIEQAIRSKPRAGSRCRKRQIWQIGG